MERSANCLAKLQRMQKALRHEEGDRVPVSDFFWGAFVRRWRDEYGLPSSADPYRYFDLDWQVTIPNMDPHIRAFEVINETEEEVVVRTGFGAVIRKRFDHAMPAFLGFDTRTLDALESLDFDDPWDGRRFFGEGDNQIAGVGDGFERNSPPWIDRVRAIHPDFPVYGSVCEAHEMLWRIIGSENALMWMAEEPDRLGAQIERLWSFAVELAEAQIHSAAGLLDGMVIWGDVAYRKGMLFSPAYWRQWFKPGVQALVDVCHSHGLPVIYHGCGNSLSIFDDFVEMGIDAYNPLEAKAGMDVVDLRRKYGHRIAFCGNMDVLEWATAPMEQVAASALRKLNAAKGGGYIFQSDHSVPDNIEPSRYEAIVKLVRDKGVFPLNLGSSDLPR